MSCLQQILNMLAENREPYYHNEWRQQPWPARSYEPIPEYQASESLAKIRSIKKRDPQGCQLSVTSLLSAIEQHMKKIVSL